MFKKIILGFLAVLALAIGIFAVIVALMPSDFRIQRSAAMAAPPDAVFAQVNDFHRWDAWSPWAKLDPNAKNSFDGASAGTGAIFRWAGNDEVGVGSMTITESNPNDLVRLRLDFQKPMESTATVEYTFKPEGDKTVVTWAMFGKNNFIGRAMCLFMDMDKMVGSKMEEGLANIKGVVEAAK